MTAADNIKPTLLTLADAAIASRVSRSTLYRLLGKGTLKAKKLGSRTLITAESLNFFLDSLQDATFQSPTVH
ncbi:AlpA family transcriptional regulator [Acidisoma sp. L85]|jgi:excisionase family DNA binding protein|uniref:helix-turn-helix transcriptional regulator n=1 Tax=Acidisoma sp. L85 TaxID=1641850 RepID=UPI00131BADDC|nr:helix-turn-helix domain-containing protein [Acidisoma sp. L85]